MGTASVKQPDSRTGEGVAALSLHAGDDVAVIIGDGQQGQHCLVQQADEGEISLTLTGPIPFGHKVALRDIATGDSVLKYGVPIGRASQDIVAGSHVHVHNLSGMKSDLTGKTKE